MADKLACDTVTFSLPANSTCLTHGPALCSWLAARAPGMTRLDLTRTLDGCHHHDLSDEEEACLIETQSRKLAIFLAMLCGALEDTSVRLFIELTGQ